MFADDFFKLKIQFLNSIIERMNSTNARLQSKGLSIHELKHQILHCYSRIAELIIKPSEFNYDPLKIIGQDLENIEVQEKLIMGQDDLFSNLLDELTLNHSICLKV